MNCATARENLFGCERPARPGPALAAHLAGCPACRTAQRRLVRVERDIPRLAVPPCPPPPALLEQVLRGPSLVTTPDRLRPNPDRARESARQKLALSLALAASLAVFAVGWWAWPRQDAPPVSPVRKQYLDRLHAKVPPATPQRQVVERLADLAEEMFAEAKAKDADGLDQLARQFDWLLRDDLPHHAGQVPPPQRQAALAAVTARVNRLESEASRLAQARRDERGAARSLRRIAAAALAAERRLRQLTEDRG